MVVETKIVTIFVKQSKIQKTVWSVSPVTCTKQGQSEKGEGEGTNYLENINMFS